jgi:endonuclease/exonuclease/phosphatase family metal-dependent hydrolase
MEKLLLPVAKQPQLEKVRWPKVSDHLPLVMTLKLLEQ